MSSSYKQSSLTLRGLKSKSLDIFDRPRGRRLSSIPEHGNSVPRY